MKYTKVYKFLFDILCNGRYEVPALKEAKEILTKQEYKKLLYELNEAKKSDLYDEV